MYGTIDCDFRMKRSTLSIFLAGAAALSSQMVTPAALADTNTADANSMGGGLQEWNTRFNIPVPLVSVINSL